MVNFVTTFECYLSELLERLVYLEPSLVADSDLQISVKDLASVVAVVDSRRWLAETIADKYLRNKTHADMINKLDRFCKAGVSASLASEIQEWVRWSLVRNSIVHTAGQVTPELSKAWPSRFPSAGKSIQLENKELSRIHYLALKLAEAIDSRAIATVIKKRDTLLLAREIFVQRGISDARALKAVLNKSVRVKVTSAEIDQTLSEQRRSVCADAWELSSRELDRIIPK